MEEGNNAAILSHAIRKMQKQQEWPLITSNLINSILEHGRIPTAQEQANNLILWLGDNLKGPGEIISITPLKHQSIIGASTPAGVGFILDYLIEEKFLKGSQSKAIGGNSVAHITLSFAGWDRYQSLRTGEIGTRKAFMAMHYGKPELDQVFFDWFKPAVEKTGFNLERLDEQPKAGSIDDRLRVEILTARFLITDLTFGNQGAYWEAGFAEGLGKPVIYTCEKRYFNREKPYEEIGGTHFDTNHHLTVIWDKKNMDEAVKRLKATIRVTLPDEAKMEDV